MLPRKSRCAHLIPWSFTNMTPNTVRQTRQSCKSLSSPWKKKKWRKWVIMLMVPRPKKIKEGKRGRWQGQKYEWWTSVFAYTCTWSKYLNCISTWRHIVWICKINGKDEHAHLFPYIHMRGLALWGSYTMSARVISAFKSSPHFQKVWKSSKLREGRLALTLDDKF